MEQSLQVGGQCRGDAPAGRRPAERQLRGGRHHAQNALSVEPDRYVRRNSLFGGVQRLRRKPDQTAFRHAARGLRTASRRFRICQLDLRHVGCDEQCAARSALRRRYDEMAQVQQLALSASADASEQSRPRDGYCSASARRLRRFSRMARFHEQRRQRHLLL